MNHGRGHNSDNGDIVQSCHKRAKVPGSDSKIDEETRHKPAKPATSWEG